MTQRLIFITVDRLKVKNATIESPLDQVIPVMLCKGGCFLKSNILHSSLELKSAGSQSVTGSPCF